MEWVKETSGIPIKSWCKNVENEAMEQANNLAQLPFAFRYIMLMPDCHAGYGMPIGGVLATKNVIIPNAVGVDIGCGMCAVKTDCIKEIGLSIVKKIIGKLREVVPVGFDHHETNQDWDGFRDAPDIQIIQQQIESAKKQIGTLGGGNHFIEIQRGDDSHIWLMLHSGSRNFGYKIAKEYHEKAKVLCERWFSRIPNKDLSFLPMGSREFSEYFKAMEFALNFACANRGLMMEKFKNIIASELKCDFIQEINIHHNYARFENHYKQNVIVHRKGATSAKKDEWGIIPGSQGTESYIVKGLGSPESFMSCSHGAGRKMGRRQAKKELNLTEQQNKLKGIVHSVRNIDDLDEAPDSYKDINEVIQSQLDLIDVMVKLTPLGVLKG